MSAEHGSHEQPDTSQGNGVSRRAVLKTGAAAAAAAAMGNMGWVAEKAGELLDALASPEDIVADRIPVLEPRADSAPVVPARPHAEPAQIETTFDQPENQPATLKLPKGVRLWAEHTETAVSEDTFTSAGTAIITTAEGLTEGEQAYCTLYKGSDQTVALGYEGGLYVYEPTLHSKSEPQSGEWVRILTKREAEDLPSHATSVWQDSPSPNNMLIEKVTEGSRTLHELGYKPWPAVLPSTQMPDMVPKEFAESECAQTIEEVINSAYEKKQFVSERGDIIDPVHLEAKAGETFDLFMQLLYRQIAGEAQPTVGVRYSSGTGARFEYAVDLAALQPDELFDAAFSLMSTTSMLMEGVSQRYLFEKVPLIKEMLPDIGGLSSEDPFSNSLGIVGMLSLLKDQDAVLDPLKRSLRSLHHTNPNLSKEALYKRLEKDFEGPKKQLAAHVLAQTANYLGVRHQELPATVDLPRGLSPLISTKISDSDASTPTRINLRAVGLQADNPNVRFAVTAVPTMGPTNKRLFEEVGF